MLKVIAQRLLSLIPVLVGVALATFFAIRLIPGDPVATYLGDSYDEKVATALRQQLGLDKDLATQFWTWLTGLVQGDLGTSLRSREPVLQELGEHFLPTLTLAAASLVIALAIALPLGLLAGRKPGSWADRLSSGLAVLTLSTPSFVLAIILITIFAVNFGILPTGGIARSGSSLWTQLQYLILPAVCLGIESTPIIMRMTRSSVIDVASLDYVRTARAKGLAENSISRRHILPNAMLPVITTVGIQVGALLGGAMVTEKVFSWPGLGTMLITAVQQRDYPLVQGGVMFVALIFVLATLITDLLYYAFDPRLRRG